jgi:cytochrome c oxidase assembly protein subunit 15
MTRLRGVLSFRRFAALTTALTLALVMLGVYTAATASGLACSAQWPLCDNGLLPQTVPSFIEWFHRLVAMVTGFFILGTAAWAWRVGDFRTRAAASAAVVLLPLQVSIGAVTVTLNGLLPQGYSPPAQGAHFVVALTIFTALVLTTLFASAGRLADGPLDRTRRALPVAFAVVVAGALFGRFLPVFDYTPAAQAAFYGTSLLAFAVVVAATVWLGRAGFPSVRVLTVGALTSLFVTMLLGRDLVYYSATVRLVNLAALAVTLALVALALYVVRRRDPRTDRRTDAGLSVD